MQKDHNWSWKPNILPVPQISSTMFKSGFQGFWIFYFLFFLLPAFTAHCEKLDKVTNLQISGSEHPHWHRCSCVVACPDAQSWHHKARRFQEQGPVPLESRAKWDVKMRFDHTKLFGFSMILWLQKFHFTIEGGLNPNKIQIACAQVRCNHTVDIGCKLSFWVSLSFTIIYS